MERETALEWVAYLQLAKVARSAVLDAGYQADSCVLSARVAHEVLRRHGIRSHPVTVRWVLVNRAWAEQHEAIAASGWDWQAFPEAWNVGIGAGEDDPGPRGSRQGWAGHLAVVAGEWLIDPSVDQGSRPERHIVAEPMAVWLDGGTIPEEGMEVVLREGIGLLYPSPRAVPKRSRDWQDPAKWGPLVDTVMAHESLGSMLDHLANV